MKKFLLTLGVACMALPSFASTRILYQQNFETAADAAAAGWSFGGASMSIASDEYGKFLELSLGQNNGRSAQVTWGQDIFMNEEGQPLLEDGTYNVSYIFNIAQGSNNQYNGEFTVFTNHAPIVNQTYRNPWSPVGCWDNYLFDMYQVDQEASMYAIDAPMNVTETTAEDGTVSKTYTVNTTDANTFSTGGTWYRVELNVNVNSREVEYTVSNDVTGDIIKSGTRVVPETDVNGDPISMYAEGLFIMLARYQTIINVDDIKVSFESAYDFCNEPTIVLSRVGKEADAAETLNLNMRAYTVSFLEGETLHFVGTDGKEVEVDYYSCNGAYPYETTTSGTIKAWTTAGTATSEVVEVAVDCAPIVLPAVTATISSVSAGFGKTYTLTVDNADVPLRPTIFIAYEFKGVNGETISATDLASGCTVTVSEEGTLTVTSEAYGYQSTSVEVKNDLEFETKQVWDFARMSEEELKAAGFNLDQLLNSDTMSGFNNWTARKRLYYYDSNSESVNEEGETVYNAVYPFGFTSTESTTDVIKWGSITDNTDGEGIFDGLNIFAGEGTNVCMMYRIGLFNDQTTGGNYKNIVVKNLDKTDFVVVNYINDYGSNSIHPIVATADDYYKVLGGADVVYSVAADGVEMTEGEGDAAVGTGLYSVTHPLYRIDTACTKITVFKQAGAVSGVEGVEAEVEGDNWYYSIDGVRMAEPTRPGIYIHNGKKIIVK